MRSPEEIKVRVWGMTRWDHVLAAQLRSVGINAFVSRPVEQSPWTQRLMHRAREVAGLTFEHVIFPSEPKRFERIAWLFGTRVIYHWIGSDVMALQKMPQRQREQRIEQLKRIASVFLADSPELADELSEMGIDCEVVRLLPLGLWGEITSLPKSFAVLSYWGLRPEFYRSDVVYQLAREMPDVPFMIAGTDGAGQQAPPNVRFLGNVSDMDSVYRQCSVLIRMPHHDSISVMVLEALARGRHVVYSKQFPHCRFAEGVDSARAALQEVMARPQLNSDGMRFVRSQFNPMAEANKALDIYQRLLGS